jgi:hypothetical protein
MPDDTARQREQEPDEHELAHLAYVAARQRWREAVETGASQAEVDAALAATRAAVRNAHQVAARLWGAP